MAGQGAKLAEALCACRRPVSGMLASWGCPLFYTVCARVTAPVMFSCGDVPELSCRAVSDRVYMPAPADAGPAAFMRWLKTYGGGGPPVTKLKNPFVGHTLPGAHSHAQRRSNLRQDCLSSCAVCMPVVQKVRMSLLTACVWACPQARSALFPGWAHDRVLPVNLTSRMTLEMLTQCDC